MFKFVGKKQNCYRKLKQNQMFSVSCKKKILYLVLQFFMLNLNPNLLKHKDYLLAKCYWKDKIYLSLTVFSSCLLLIFTIIQQLLTELNFLIFSVAFLIYISYFFLN